MLRTTVRITEPLLCDTFTDLLALPDGDLSGLFFAAALSFFAYMGFEDVVKLAETARDEIAAGKRHPFTGPIAKQDGTPWLKAGETATDKDLSSMNFYVQGMEGSLPK